jgi:hypothetical protein|tara:strand:- start:24152 stop:24427 length:276 start_codon:yes stop_codon:yes gene_type:complete
MTDPNGVEINKVTPLHDITWYVKWAATFVMIVAICCRSVDEVPRIYDQIVSLIGLMGWFFVAYKWHDRALMTVNLVAIPILLTGILRWIVQ